MNLAVIGLNHRTAPVEVREQLCFSEKELPSALRQACALEGIVETIIVSTCNRVELLASGTDGSDVISTLARFLSESRSFPLVELERHLYQHQQRDAVRHVFRVAASLDSMVLGEPQVLGQVKAAYALAKTAETVGALLEELLTRAFHVAKRVRTETAIGTAAVSISSAAVELAKKIFGHLEGKTVLVIGAGKMSELAAKHLLGSGASTVFVANRTHERAQELAQLFGGKAIRFESLPDYIEQSDIIISSTGAPHHVIRKADAQKFLARRKNRPMFFVDIAVPRDIDPEINQLDNVFLYDIDDLEQVVAANRKEREREAQKAEEIVSREADKLIHRLKALDVVPTIVSLQRRLEEVRAEELERARSKLGPLTPGQEQALDFMTRSMVNKILHSPIQELKSISRHPDGLRLVEFVRKVFNLKD